MRFELGVKEIQFNSPVYVGIVGSRQYPNHEHIHELMEALTENDIVVTGCAYSGADQIARSYKTKAMYRIIVQANWHSQGKKAGFVRNPEIIRLSDVVFAFWDGQSAGTLNSINHAKATNKKVVVINPVAQLAL